MASAAVDLLIGKLVSLIESETSLIGNFDNELRGMKDELQGMRSFLVDAHSITDQSEQEKTWVAQVRDAAIELQDIIDEFNYHKNKIHTSRKFTRCFRKTINFPQTLWVKRKLASKLQMIKRTINEILERKNRYERGHPSGETPSHVGPHDWLRIHHESPLFLKDVDVVGFDVSKDAIRQLLVNEDLERNIISIWGVGGSGKTTLVANVYNNSNTKRHFDCWAWITVSQRYEVQDIFRSMIKDLYNSRKDDIPEDLISLDSRSLLEKLVSYLQSKTYLIVLDDVWSSDLWEQIKIAFPEGLKGSRVVLTTRSEAIASYAFGVQSHVHRIEPLKENEAFNLFCKKAFSNKRCPRNLESIAKSFADKCDGLSLAIVALGGLMSSKRQESEWRMVERSLNWQIRHNPDLQKMKSILLLSYNDLPYRLKLCFLYCSVFPEDYPIKKKRLIRLWLAEGFLEEIDGLTLEEVGEMYLMELVRRSLLDKVETDKFGRPKKQCRMHDILREIAISISANEKFSTICKDKKAMEDRNNAPIMVIQENIWSNFHYSFPKVRSFLVFIIETLDPSPSITLSAEFKFLRVLDFQGLNIDKVPDDIMICYNLTYLNLAKTKVRELPKSIGKLSQLRTLDLRETYIQVLPSGITKLHNLRHLLVYNTADFVLDSFNYGSGVEVPPNIWKLENLQVLGFVNANIDLVRELKNLSNLRRLYLCKVTEEVQKDICLAIETMEHLYNLVVKAADEQTVLRLDSLSSTPPRLKKLMLFGMLGMIPFWFQSLRNLTQLWLFWTRLDDDFLPYIEALPNLDELLLNSAYNGEQLYFGTGFQKLRHLYILFSPHMKEIVIKDGVMPNIQDLGVVQCLELETVHGIGHLKSLENVNFVRVPKLRDNVLHDLEKLEHQPYVFWNQNGN